MSFVKLSTGSSFHLLQGLQFIYGLTHKLKKELSTFNDDDYLLLMGDPAIIALAGAVVSEMNRGKFKILKWDRDEKRYYDIEIDLWGRDE